MPGMEPRMRPRPKGPQFHTEDLEAMLIAFGDDFNPLPETIRVLDDIVTDFIIETCHEAEHHARHSGRAKIKVEDFQFALRHDAKKLGRVQELLDLERTIQKNKQMFNTDEGKVRKAQQQQQAAQQVGDEKGDGGGEDGVGGKKKRKGKKKARVEVGEDDISLDGMEDGKSVR